MWGNGPEAIPPAPAEPAVSRAATALFSAPAAHPRTIRARNAKACAVLRRAASAVSSDRSAALRTKAAHRALVKLHVDPY